MSARKPHKLLLVSDTHGFIHPDIVALCADVDSIIHAGDIGAQDVLQQLTASGTNLIAIRGNNDVEGKWPEAQAQLLKHLPLQQQTVIGPIKIQVDHGHRFMPATRRHQLLRAKYAESDVIVYGHSHKLIIDDTDTPVVVNPGAAGRARTYGGASCIVVQIRNHQLKFLTYRFDK